MGEVVAISAPEAYRHAPYDIDVEQALLGAILADNRSLEPASALIKAEHFYDPLHGRIFETMSQMIGRGGVVVTPLTLHATMKADPGVIETGGQDYLGALRAAAPAIPNIKDLASILADLAIRRSLIRIGDDIVNTAYDGPKETPSSKQIELAEASLRAVSEKNAELIGPPRIPLVPFAQIGLSKARRDLVKGLIPREGLTVIWGPPKCGKSFWLYDLSMHVALGWEYRGRRVQQGKVVYCAFEGQAGMEARSAAFRQQFRIADNQDVPFYLQPVRLDLVAQNLELVAAIKTQLRGDAPVLVVLDTLNRSFSGSESSDEDMSGYIAAADIVREAFSCAVVIVHHCGLDSTRPRGHTSLTGAVEAQLAVRRDASNAVMVTVELAKDGPQGEKIVSRLEVVQVGRDQDGEAIFSCIVVPSDGEVVPAKQRVSGAAEIALRLLRKAIDEAGQVAPPTPHIPAGTRTISPEKWRASCYQGGISESTDPDTRRRAFVRATQTLQNKNLIGIWHDHVWLR